MAGAGWIARRTIAVLRREGPLGTVQRIVKHGRIALGVPSAEDRAAKRRKAEADAAFDAALGVDTGGTQHLYEFDIPSPNAALGVSHIATGPEHFHRAMALLDIDPAGLTFVDLGAGKGRCLLMAADYPFAAITGVEFAPELAAICGANIERFGDPRLTCQIGDVADYQFPTGDLVVFMNNPFDRPLVAEVARRLAASVQAHPRVVRLVYVNPRAPDLFGAPPWFPVGSAEGAAVLGLGQGGGT